MAKVGILTEKPSAAAAFAAALGGTQGNYQGVEYVIANARGHLFELAEPELQLSGASDAEVASMKSWDLSNLPWDLSRFNWEYVPIKGSSKFMSDIRLAFKDCDEIVNGCDVDPSGEGSLIYANIVKALGLDGRKQSRMYFTDEAAPSLQKAFMGRKAVPDLDRFDEYQMASFRSSFDFASIQFTRAATASAAQGSVLRQGRLKSAMVLLVGDQLAAREAYVKTEAFQNRFRDDLGVMYTNPAEPVFATEAEVPQKYGPSKVKLDSRSMKRTPPRRQLDLSALSARLSTQGVKADQVLAVYQKMYEAKVVSYPRTDDKTITTEQFNELLPLADKIAGVVGVDVSLLTERTPRRTHVKDSGAHGANRPGPVVPASLESLSGKFGPVAPLIYAEVARSYLAMLAPDYVYESQEGHIEKYPEFTGKASVPKSMGWKLVFSDSDDTDADESSKGLGTDAEPIVYVIVPPKPEHPTMTWLMKQLAKRDVGTGATRTSTYADVTQAASKRNKWPLLHDSSGKITMTDFGDQSHRLLPGTNIGNLGITEHVYAAMREIAAGHTTADKELAIVATWVSEDIRTMQRNGAAMRKELGLDEQVQQKEKYEGTWVVTGETIKFSRQFGSHRFSDEECEALLAGEEISMSPVSASTGNPYDVFGRLEPQEYKEVSYVGFKANFGKKDASGKIAPPTAWCKHVFTPEETAKLAAGEKVAIEGFISKKGKSFNATVSFTDEEKAGDWRIKPDFG